MSIDETISDALFDYCIAWRDRASAAQDKVEAELRAAIEQHVAEAVEKEITRRARIIESQDACPSFCNRMATRRAARGTP